MQISHSLIPCMIVQIYCQSVVPFKISFCTIEVMALIWRKNSLELIQLISTIVNLNIDVYSPYEAPCYFYLHFKCLPKSLQSCLTLGICDRFQMQSEILFS